MSLYVKSSALTHPGRKRNNNEDFVTFFEPDIQEDIQASGSLYIVADGVGGAAKGERASQYAAQKVLHEYYRYPQMEIGERLKVAMRQSGNEIFTFAEESSGFRMATTMVAAVVRGDLLTIANVGDSRAYLIRNGIAKQITRDHSLVGEMVRDGVMTEEEARHSKVKNRITRSLGGEQNVHVDVFPDIPLQVGDKVLLCSDGFSQYANLAQIAQFISQGAPSEITERMIDHALRSGGSDNISTILLDAVPSTSEAATLRIKRGQMPTAVDWETMDTSPVMSHYGYQRRTARLRLPEYLWKADWIPPLINWHVAIIGFFVVAVLTACVLGSLLLITKGKETPMLPVIPAAEVVSPTKILEVLPTATFAEAVTPAILANTPLPTPTLMVTSTPELPPSATIDPEKLIFCRYDYDEKEPPIYSDGDNAGQSIPSDAIAIAIEVFGKELKTNEDIASYAKNIRCADAKNNTACMYKFETPYFMIDTWVLEFPDIPYKKCQDAGGTPVPPTNSDN